MQIRSESTLSAYGMSDARLALTHIQTMKQVNIPAEWSSIADTGRSRLGRRDESVDRES